MNLEAQLLEGIRALPPEKQVEVLDFVEFIRQRSKPLAQMRPIGLCKGEFSVPEDFDAPLPEDILQDFEA